MTQHFPPEGGAHAGRWDWLSSGLLNHGHRLDVVVPRWGSHTRHHGGRGLTVREVRAIVPGLSLRRRVVNEALTGLQTIVAGLRSPRPDVVVATVPALVTLPAGWLVAKLRGRPLVVELRDAWPHLLDDMHEWADDGTHDEPFPVPVARFAPVLRAAIWHVLHSSDAVITTTDSLARDLRAHGLAHVSVARNTARGVDLLPPPDDHHPELRVLYLGVLGRAQRLAVAIDAAALLRDSDTPVSLRIVGDGAHKQALMTYAHRLGVEVDWRDRVPESETAEQLAWADTVLISLRRWAGMNLTVPSKLYPTMMAGRHISASVEGETADIIRQSGAGDVVPPEDPQALAQLWRDLAHERQRLRISPLARGWALAGSPEVSVRHVEKALLTAAGQLQGGPAPSRVDSGAT
ncbi:glycosyltransferase family 4 protein [Aestuariimicrobium soli]|uniref:glycosyltransferase family 4 protein n=1 Tax=Aestuariimicrobium soli TaxID=2035834 RepID=UPI003EB86BAC